MLLLSMQFSEYGRRSEADLCEPMFNAKTICRVFALALWFFSQGNGLYAGNEIIHRLLAFKSGAIEVAQVQKYHVSFTWDSVTNATGYALLVKTNGVESWRVPAATNYVTVSNLDFNLDQYRFFCVATNSAGESLESSAAALHWITISNLYATNVNGPWSFLVTNSFEPVNSAMFFRTGISNWSAAAWLHKD